MLINPLIRKTLKEIATKSSEYHNKPDLERKYIRRLLKVYNTHLTEEERIYLLKYMLDMIHYKNIVTDDNNLLTVYNMKLRIILSIVLSICFLLIFAAFLFETNVYINDIVRLLSSTIAIVIS